MKQQHIRHFLYCTITAAGLCLASSSFSASIDELLTPSLGPVHGSIGNLDITNIATQTETINTLTVTYYNAGCINPSLGSQTFSGGDRQLAQFASVDFHINSKVINNYKPNGFPTPGCITITGTGSPDNPSNDGTFGTISCTASDCTGDEVNLLLLFS